jgi:hypothetical protein
VLSTPSHFTLPLAVAMFQSQYSTDTARVFAYTALSMLPALSIFVFAQRYLVGGLVGAIRGLARFSAMSRATTTLPPAGERARSPAGRDHYRPAPLGTRCGAPEAASRRSCWSSV